MPLLVPVNGRVKVRRKRRAALTAFDADFELSLEGGTPGDPLSATFLNANSVASAGFTGAWTTHAGGGSTFVRTKVTSDFYPRRNPIRIGGAVRPSSGSRGWEIDLTGRDGNDGNVERFRYTLDEPALAAVDGKNYIIGLMGYFNVADTPDPATGNQATALDFIESHAGTFNVLQYFNEIGSSNVSNIHSHSQLGGESTNSLTDNPTQRDVLYSIYSRVMVEATPKRAEVWLIDGTTGVLLGYCKSGTGSTGLQDFEFKDYIAAYGGAVKLGRIVAAYGARAVVLEDFTIATPAWSAAAQTAVGEITLGWSSTRGCVSLVECRVNGGAWDPLLTEHTATSYIHAGLTDGSTYEYRVTIQAAEYSSAVSATSAPATIDDGTFLLDRAEAWDEGNAFPADSGGKYVEWNNSVGNSRDLYVLSGRPLGEGSGWGVHSYKTAVATYGPQQRVSAAYQSDTDLGGPMVRIQAGAAAGYGAFIQNNPGLGQKTLRIFKVTDSGSAAVVTQMGADLHGTEITWAHGDLMEIKAINTDVAEVTLTAYRNGTQVGTTRVDTTSPYMSGQPGIGLDGGSRLGAVRMREVSS